MHIFSRLRKSRTKKKRKKATVLFNVFNTSYSKTALLSYVKEVFEDEQISIDKGHTNRFPTLCIAEIVSELGYNIDVINWQSSYIGIFSKYELVIGLGKALDDALKIRNEAFNPYVIWFGTGCNPLFSNQISLQRITDFYFRKGKVLLSSSRYVVEDWPLQHEIADWIILHGDNFALSTYRDYNIDTILAPVFLYHAVERDDNKWMDSRANYLWFGSTGAIHKGLDILIETFKDLPQFNLHICGDFYNESEFFNIYEKEIESCDNIICHGFINVESEHYKEVLNKCAFIIFPSASEGNSASVLTCMANGGLIPIVTKNTDINMDNYGVEIFGFNEADIRDAIERSQNLDLNELKEQNKLILLQTSKYHSFDYFRNDFKNKLNQALATLSKVNS